MTVTREIGMQEVQKIKVFLDGRDDVSDVQLVGSSFINGTGKDADVLILCDNQDELAIAFEYADCVIEGEPESGGGDNSFISLRTDDSDGYTTNILLTDDQEVFDTWVAAAHACRYVHEELGVALAREHRVQLHQIIMDGVRYDD